MMCQTETAFQKGRIAGRVGDKAGRKDRGTEKEGREGRAREEKGKW